MAAEKSLDFGALSRAKEASRLLNTLVALFGELSAQDLGEARHEVCGLVTLLQSANGYILDHMERGAITKPASPTMIREAIQKMLAERVQGSSVASFRDSGIPTPDEGLILSLEDGREFQISIVPSWAPPAHHQPQP